MIKTTIQRLRDPYIVVTDDAYYAYGTDWHCFKNAGDDLAGPWEDLGEVVQLRNPADVGVNHWAPEVHLYKGAYYMITTYNSLSRGRRGCTVLKSDSPEGPFVEISDGPVTPVEWDAIDGTLYVDPDGQPWMVFVHEWVCMPDGIGSFAAAKLADDLTRFVSEPFEMFKAMDFEWPTRGITDGCWMHTTKSGKLLMTWSNFFDEGYAVAVVESSNGRLDGEWRHVDMLYTRSMTVENRYDGGHAMLFTARNGQMYMSFHSPNQGSEERWETPVFLAVREENDRIVWDEPRPAHN